MGGRGRGGGGGSQTARAVAQALGIARHDMAAYTTNQTRTIEAPPLYPTVQRALIPLEVTPELQYIADLKLEMITRFRESAFYLDQKEKKDIRRYTDKYNVNGQEEKLNPDFDRLPAELMFRKEKREEHKAKKRKMADTDDVIKDKLNKLEEKEGEGEDNEDEEEGSEKGSEQMEGEALSEEDYAEEDNDYITTYFDNGEGYGGGGEGSDDNMDGDEY